MRVARAIWNGTGQVEAGLPKGAAFVIGKVAYQPVLVCERSALRCGIWVVAIGFANRCARCRRAHTAAPPRSSERRPIGLKTAWHCPRKRREWVGLHLCPVPRRGDHALGGRERRTVVVFVVGEGTVVDASSKVARRRRHDAGRRRCTWRRRRCWRCSRRKRRWCTRRWRRAGGIE